MKQKKLIFLTKGKWTRMLFSLVFLMVLMTGIAFAQQKSISGKISDQSGAMIPGASVIIKGTTTGTVTDNNGKFTLTNVSEKSTLVVSFVGMKPQEIIVGNKTDFAIVLIEESIGIDEVVVCLLYTSDAADDLLCVDLGGRRII